MAEIIVCKDSPFPFSTTICYMHEVFLLAPCTLTERECHRRSFASHIFKQNGRRIGRRSLQLLVLTYHNYKHWAVFIWVLKFILILILFLFLWFHFVIRFQNVCHFLSLSGRKAQTRQTSPVELLAPIFPRLQSNWWRPDVLLQNLIGSLLCLHLLWFGRVISLVLALWHSVENHSRTTAFKPCFCLTVFDGLVLGKK